MHGDARFRADSGRKMGIVRGGLNGQIGGKEGHFEPEGSFRPCKLTRESIHFRCTFDALLLFMLAPRPSGRRLPL